MCACVCEGKGQLAVGIVCILIVARLLSQLIFYSRYTIAYFINNFYSPSTHQIGTNGYSKFVQLHVTIISISSSSNSNSIGINHGPLW